MPQVIEQYRRCHNKHLQLEDHHLSQSSWDKLMKLEDHHLSQSSRDKLMR